MNSFIRTFDFKKWAFFKVFLKDFTVLGTSFTERLFLYFKLFYYVNSKDKSSKALNFLTMCF